MSALSAYGLASNASLYCTKIAVSVMPGRPLDPIMSSALQAHSIDAAQPATAASPTACIYLGIPLALSQAQVLDFFSALLRKTQTSLHMHGSMPLSLAGKTTAWNSLVASKLQCYLWLFTLPRNHDSSTGKRSPGFLWT
ncbi:hypothetical protein DM01DRAFT_1375828 [Hesseltinella vesiculosa]|uniref:Uncharacterized protein n=1 Tax=Hesseltinella vesiculosa TaxID=101127 RepID=A0A1X2GCC1_9FUNG|nr:hypothetical protein DM01DRAFT_1375828 [Hesseltinella vesiculosa]